MLTALFLLAILAAATLNATVGFGDSMLNMVLVSALIGLQTTTPLVALISLSSTFIILLGSWRYLAFRQVAYMLLGAVVCVPLGIYGAKILDLGLLKILLGLSIVLVALYNLLSIRLMQIKREAWGLVFGALSGLMGGAFNITGPPAVMFGVLRGWTAQSFRANLQGFFFPLGLAITSSHYLAGNFNAEVLGYYLWAMPTVVLGNLLGARLNARIREPERFARYVYFLLLILGASLWF